MKNAASILFWCAAVRRPQALFACRSGALVWARPSAATPAGADGWGRWGARCAGPAAPPPPPRRGPFLGEGGRPLCSGGAEGRSCGPQAGGGQQGGGGVGGPPQRPPSPCPVGRRPATCCLRRAPPGYTPTAGVAVRPRASGAAWSAANGSVRRGGGGGGGSPARVRAHVFPGRPLKGPLRLRRPGRRRSAIGRQRAGGGCGAAGVQLPLRGGCGAAVSSVCLRRLLGLRRRGGGVGAALWSPGAAP